MTVLIFASKQILQVFSSSSSLSLLLDAGDMGAAAGAAAGIVTAAAAGAAAAGTTPAAAGVAAAIAHASH